jgi:tetratricopeptide (TPR) repeat protein
MAPVTLAKPVVEEHHSDNRTLTLVFEIIKWLADPANTNVFVVITSIIFAVFWVLYSLGIFSETVRFFEIVSTVVTAVAAFIRWWLWHHRKDALSLISGQLKGNENRHAAALPSEPAAPDGPAIDSPLVNFLDSPLVNFQNYTPVSQGIAAHPRNKINRGTARPRGGSGVNARLRSGYAYFAKKDYDCAIEDYSEAIRLDSKCVNAHFNRGVSYFAKKDFDRAIEDFGEAIWLDPSDAHKYSLRGAAYLRKRPDKSNNKRDFQSAMADFNHAIEINPKDRIAELGCRIVELIGRSNPEFLR